MRRSALIALGALILAASPQSADACSFSWKPGHSPDEIKERGDVRRLEGKFVVVEARGQPGDDGYLYQGVIYGRIESKSGTVWQTFQPYDRFLVECMAYPRPATDAVGTFWISRWKTDGRYELLVAEWENLPKPNAPDKTQDDGQPHDEAPK